MVCDFRIDSKHSFNFFVCQRYGVGVITRDLLKLALPLKGETGLPSPYSDRNRNGVQPSGRIAVWG